ncbi:hypothetical protein F383_25203 [Gossypium arboreum]|uniref:Uncharacterized protein n=1 Tax=Gossypium arboreum TaxID=29729 RepID=A0A0B0P5Y0_GOSAR|nr:hypothetical protein F383_25203 [Gossypium arboreum]
MQLACHRIGSVQGYSDCVSMRHYMCRLL